MKDINKTCAYCGKEAQLTKEHIVPNFLYKANPSSKFGYNVKADKFMTWEAQIKDVCADCNNNHLSKVDSYAERFYRMNQIDKLITNDKMIRMTYDFSMLCRFLLKVTYNCSRYKGYNTQGIESCRNLILYGKDSPIEFGIKIAVEIVPCHKITDKERMNLSKVFKQMIYFNPHMIRIGRTYGISPNNVYVHYVFINNFYFYLILYHREIPQEQVKSVIKSLKTVCPSMIFIHPHKSSITLQVSKSSILDRYSDIGMALAEKWDKYLNENPINLLQGNDHIR